MKQKGWTDRFPAAAELEEVVSKLAKKGSAPGRGVWPYPVGVGTMRLGSWDASVLRASTGRQTLRATLLPGLLGCVSCPHQGWDHLGLKLDDSCQEWKAL